MSTDELKDAPHSASDEHEHAVHLYESAYGSGPAAAKQQTEKTSPGESATSELPTDKPVAGAITISGAEQTITVWEDGSRRVDRLDGSWILNKPTKDGGYREEHGGNQRPEENFVLVKGKDGRFSLAESMSDRTSGLPDRHEVFSPLVQSDSPGHKLVAGLADAKIQNPQQLAKFLADMIRFESRMANRDLGTIEADVAYRALRTRLQIHPTQVNDSSITPAAPPRSMPRSRYCMTPQSSR